MSDPLVAAARKIRARHRAGSSVEHGKLYHALEAPGLPSLPAHRPRTAQRVEQIVRGAPVAGKRILDLGCGPGGVSIGLALAGAARVVGVDYDEQAIAVGRAAVERLGLEDRVELRVGKVQDEAEGELFDCVVWLSQWMWSAKQLGVKPALDLLHAISRRAETVVFETAADDGEAGRKNVDQRWVELALEKTLAQERIRSEASPGGWFARRVFFCDRPRLVFQGWGAQVVRVSRDRVLKSYLPVAPRWMPDREAAALDRLSASEHFPRVLGRPQPRDLLLNWCGWSSRVAPAMQSQAEEILEDLRRARVRHRDVRPPNVLAVAGRLKLIDFGWSLFDDELETPSPGPPELGTMPDGTRYGPGDRRAFAQMFQSVATAANRRR